MQPDEQVVVRVTRRERPQPRRLRSDPAQKDRESSPLERQPRRLRIQGRRGPPPISSHPCETIPSVLPSLLNDRYRPHSVATLR
jgi:hypothetical protein